MKFTLTHEARHLLWALFIALDVALLFILVTVVDFSGSLYAGIAAVCLLAIIPGLFFVHGMSHSAYQITGEGLTIHRRANALHVLFQNILRVDRQQKTEQRERGAESVRITFRHFGKTETIELSPACSKSFVSDILEHCPQLTSSKKQVLVRNMSFDAARNALLEEPTSRERMDRQDLY